MMLRIQQIRIEVRDLRARAALAAATGGTGDVQARLTSARRDAKKILNERTQWGNPFAHLILGGAYAAEGELERSRDQSQRSRARVVAANSSRGSMAEGKLDRDRMTRYGA
jgi:hypothetical protein